LVVSLHGSTVLLFGKCSIVEPLRVRLKRWFLGRVLEINEILPCGKALGTRLFKIVRAFGSFCWISAQSAECRHLKMRISANFPNWNKK